MVKNNYVNLYLKNKDLFVILPIVTSLYFEI